MKYYIKRFIILNALLILYYYSNAQIEITTTSDTRFVLRNEIYNGTENISIISAKNEWEFFQVLLRSSSNHSSINYVITDLVDNQGNVISNENFKVYREYYMFLDSATHGNPNEFTPAWYPDPLIPDKHPLTNEKLNGKLKAFPFDLPANQTHAILVDVFIPKTAQAGTYNGQVQIYEGDNNVGNVDITLKVWDFTLPDIYTIKNDFGPPTLGTIPSFAEQQKDPEKWRKVKHQCLELASRHHLNVLPDYGVIYAESKEGQYHITDEMIDTLNRFIDVYHSNALRVPTRFGWPGGLIDRYENIEKSAGEIEQLLSAWDNAMARLNRPDFLPYIWLIDEPNRQESYQTIRNWGKSIKGFNSDVKVLVTEQTYTDNEDWGNLYGAVDIWCPVFGAYNEESAKKRMENMEQIWAYTFTSGNFYGNRSTSWVLDIGTLLDCRVFSWMAWKYNVSGILYWSMTRAVFLDDGWDNPRTYRQRSRPKNVFNGEAGLVYKADTVGYTGIAPSLRLKAMRDAFDDFEYMTIIRKAGYGEFAQEVIDSLVNSWTDWDKNPEKYEDARKVLGDFISQNKLDEYVKEVGENNSFNILNHFPNPFNKIFNLDVYLSNRAKLNVYFYDLSGRLIFKDNLGVKEKGVLRLQYSADDFNNQSGYYICEIIAGNSVKSLKVICLTE